MSGVPVEKINKIREDAEYYLVTKYGMNCGMPIEIIDNYNHDDAPLNAGRLWHLGRSIQQLGEADAVYFCKGNCKARGCLIERLVVFIYKIPILK